MNEKPIRVLVVDADPGGGQALLEALDQGDEFELLGVARNRQTAIQQAETSQPDVVVIDLMLTGYRSIDVINNVSGTLPGVKVLALSPSDPPHERILLAMQAGSLGYITRDAEAAEIKKAIHQVYEGNPWLPVQDTYEVLQEAAPELAVSAEERRDRLTQIVLGIIPLSGIIAAITALLWREYWGKIGVRVVDLGIDPTTRMIDVLVFILMLVGMFGPLMFIDTWLKGLGNWLAEKTAFTNTVAKVRKVRLFKLPVGRLLFNHLMAWVLMALIILSIGILLHAYAQLILIMIIGPLVGVLLLVNILSMEDQLPNMFTISNLGNRRAVAVISVFLLGFLFVLGAEVLIREPDLRTNGMHGILAPKVLGFTARPVTVYDLDEKHEPLGALYLGGNADLYVLYDPCAETVRFVPVGSSRVEVIDQVSCESP